MDEIDQIIAYRKQGFYCSQIIMIRGLELLGKQNPDLIRSMNALAGGLGFSGELCGALTGGACLLGLYAGKGLPQQEQDPRLDFMVMDLVKWFKTEYEPLYGGVRCEQILNGNRQNQSIRCPSLVIDTFQKVKELLVENGFDLAGLET